MIYIVTKYVDHLQQTVCAALIEVIKADLMPSDADITVMKTLMEVLQPMVQINEAIGGEKLVQF